MAEVRKTACRFSPRLVQRALEERQIEPLSIGMQKGPLSLRLVPVVHRGTRAPRRAPQAADAAAGGFLWTHRCKPWALAGVSGSALWGKRASAEWHVPRRASTSFP